MHAEDAGKLVSQNPQLYYIPFSNNFPKHHLISLLHDITENHNFSLFNKFGDLLYRKYKNLSYSKEAMRAKGS